MAVAATVICGAVADLVLLVLLVAPVWFRRPRSKCALWRVVYSTVAPACYPPDGKSNCYLLYAKSGFTVAKSPETCQGKSEVDL